MTKLTDWGRRVGSLRRDGSKCLVFLSTLISIVLLLVMADGSQQTGLKIIIPYPLSSPNRLGPPTVPLRAWSLKHICCTLFEIQRGPTPSHVFACASLESKTKGETFIWRLVTGCTPLLLCHLWTGSGAFRHQNNLWFTQLWIEDGKNITIHLAHDWASVCICQNDWSSHDSNNPWSRVIWLPLFF